MAKDFLSFVNRFYHGYKLIRLFPLYIRYLLKIDKRRLKFNSILLLKSRTECIIIGFAKGFNK